MLFEVTRGGLVEVFGEDRLACVPGDAFPAEAVETEGARLLQTVGVPTGTLLLHRPDEDTGRRLHTDVSSLVQVAARFQRLLDEFSFTGEGEGDGEGDDGSAEEADFERLEGEVERTAGKPAARTRSRSGTTRPSGRWSATRSPQGSGSRPRQLRQESQESAAGEELHLRQGQVTAFGQADG